MSLENKTILITGGVGSFGQKFIEIALREYNPKSLRVYDQSEFGIVDAERKFQDDRLRFLIGDIRDKERLSRAMNGVDVVVHAAALKHVPAAEYNPIEVIKTNILGTSNVIDAAIDNGVQRAMFISTDKAMNPVNLYGATKLCAERLFTQGNSYTGGRGTLFSSARYGNVLGSNGSVIPLFLQQREKGFVTLTDERMTRFWITLEQGVKFVIQNIERMRGGEVFVPKIPSMKLVDLIDTLAPGVERKIIGMRSGEKLHEMLLNEYEARRTREYADYFVIEPEFPFWDEDREVEDGKPVPEGFQYTSDTNTWWLTKEELEEMIKHL